MFKKLFSNMYTYILAIRFIHELVTTPVRYKKYILKDIKINTFFTIFLLGKKFRVK